jgi:hypothetical protein
MVFNMFVSSFLADLEVAGRLAGLVDHGGDLRRGALNPR